MSLTYEDRKLAIEHHASVAIQALYPEIIKQFPDMPKRKARKLAIDAMRIVRESFIVDMELTVSRAREADRNRGKRECRK